MKKIEKIKGYFIYKCLFSDRDLLTLHLKKSLLENKTELIVKFKSCFAFEDLRLNSVELNDYSIQDLGYKYLSSLRKENKEPKEYKEFLVFNKKEEKIISTGIEKKVVFSVIFKEIEIIIL